MIHWLNVGLRLAAGILFGLAIDGWWEAGAVFAGFVLMFVHFDFKPSIAGKAMMLLQAHYRFMHHLWKEIDREWRPMGGQENEAKRVIVTEIRDTIPAAVQELIEKELQK